MKHLAGAVALLGVLLQFGVARAEDATERVAESSEKQRTGPSNLSETAPVSVRKSDKLQLEEVIITATPVEISKLRSSVAVSTLDPEQIQQSVPANVTDILRNVPGVFAQASGGEGNANVTVRGLPISGGAKFTQFQEDGLPVLDFGDIEFATADTFVKADYNVERLEVVRGGSAATLTSNAPGGVFNFISKTGDVAGGSLGLTHGLDFDRTRLDFDYGEPINPQWRYHVGGFYRTGEGPRSVGYTSESGGQFKGNVTRSFANGYLRLNFKLLDDRTPVYLPVPISITGSKSNPDISSLPGFDARDGALQSPSFLRDLSVDQSGNRVVTDIADGYRAKSQALGGEASFTLEDHWKLEDKFRVASTSGRFVGPYPAEVNTASALATEIGGAGATLRYAAGAQAGQTIPAPDALNGNGLAVRTHLFNTTLNDFDNAANDLRVTRFFESPRFGATSLTFGYFKSRQTIDMDWHWNTYLQEVKGHDAALLDVVDAGGHAVTQQGLVAYGEPFWDNCCVRSYQLHYDTDAPYLAVNWQQGPFNIDGSLRYDIARASGTYAGAPGTTVLDVNGDGAIQGPEQAVPIVDSGSDSPVDYTHRYLSYSFGGNYLLNPDLALFLRISEGSRFNATRVLFGGGIRPDGSIAEALAVNQVQQYEGGAKWRSEHFSVFATLFYATTEFKDQDITSVTERFHSREFEAKGLELEAGYHNGGLSVNGGVTYTRGEVAKDDLVPANEGRQVNPHFLYQLTPAYDVGKFGFGLNVIGASDVPALAEGWSNPGFVQVNAFASYALARGLSLSVQGNNLFDETGFTEIQNASGPLDNLATGRSITGRAIEATLKYSF